MRKFKILKDTPQDKAGDIFIKNNDIIYINQRSKSSYIKETIENNPEWFEEIMEPKFETDFNELKDTNGWFVDLGNGGIKLDNDNNYGKYYNVFSTRSLAKSCLALAQLSQFAKEWNSLVENDKRRFYTVIYDNEGLTIASCYIDNCEDYYLYKIKFNTSELAELSLQHHKDLWLDYYQKNNEEN